MVGMIMEMAQTNMALQLFRVATDSVIGFSTILDTTVVGGVLPRMVPVVHGAGVWSTGTAL